MHIKYIYTVPIHTHMDVLATKYIYAIPICIHT